MLESLGDGERWGGGEFAGCSGGVTPAEDFGKGFDVEFFEFGFGYKNDCGGAIVERGGVGSSDGAAVGDEGGFDGAKFVWVKLCNS